MTLWLVADSMKASILICAGCFTLAGCVTKPKVASPVNSAPGVAGMLRQSIRTAELANPCDLNVETTGLETTNMLSIWVQSCHTMIGVNGNNEWPIFLEYSDNLKDWTLLAPSLVDPGSLYVDFQVQQTFPLRFYRARSQH